MTLHHTWSKTHIDIAVDPTGSAVFVPVLKAGSTYWIEQFTRAGWQRQPITEIPSHLHRYCFGFICDPVMRYKRGLIEDLASIMGRDLSFVRDMPTQYWRRPQIMGVHTLPITQFYDVVYQQIQWIDLAHSTQALQHICENLGIPAVRESTECNRHSASPQHQALRSHIFGSVPDGLIRTWLEFYAPMDQDLWRATQHTRLPLLGRSQ